MTDTENKALYIAEQCRKAGMTLAGAAGVVANIEAESAFIPINVQDCFEGRVGPDAVYTRSVDSGAYTRFATDGVGYGLAQWTAADRKEGMLRFHKARGESIGDFQTQVDWLIQEMRGYSRAWNTVTTSNDPFECGYTVCRYYEIPADTENQANHRGGRARVWYSFLQANAGSGSTIPEGPAAGTGSEPEKDDDGIEIPTTWPPRTIDKEHCSGWPEIRLMQTALICRGYNALDNGIFDKAAEDKLKAFQKDSGLQDDGVCGPLTWAALLRMPDT